MNAYFRLSPFRDIPTRKRNRGGDGESRGRARPLFGGMPLALVPRGRLNAVVFLPGEQTATVRGAISYAAADVLRGRDILNYNSAGFEEPKKSQI